MATWFECKLKYDKPLESGAMKSVTEPFVVNALSVTEAETRIVEEMEPLTKGTETVVSVRTIKISEVFFNENADRWYMVKFSIITLDERSGKEKEQTYQTLVAATDFQNAFDNFKEGMKGTLADYEIKAITLSPIVDVFKEKLS